MNRRGQYGAEEMGLDRKYLIVKKYIDEMDYGGLLSMGAPDNEFDVESLEISGRISNARNEQDIAQIIADVFNREFDHTDAAERFLDCAGKIYADWHC